MENKEYKICNSCIMDTSDPNIYFNDKGVCNYCLNFRENIVPTWNYGENRELVFNKKIEKIKTSSKKKEFDCILGLSGGLDSSFMAHIAVKKFGLRPLLFHVDTGWNSERAVNNIEKIVNGLGLDLFTEVINWEEMKGLQRSFFMSQIPDQDYPQDIAFMSTLYKFARKNNIKYILNGSNFSTECCREPEEWGGYLGVDTLLVNDIIKKFKQVNIKTFPLVDILIYKIFYRYFLNIQSINPLNHIKYEKASAEKELSRLYDYQPFKHKHHESRFTRFYEDYWLPKKFSFEKRRAHFSSLIMTNQMKRKDAIKRISSPELSKEQHQKEFEYVAKKLGFSKEEFQNIFNGENKTYKNYSNKRNIIHLGAKILRFFGLEKRYF